MNLAHYIYILTFLALTSFKVNAQQNVCLGDDISVCIGSTVTIDNCQGTPGNTTGIVMDNATSVSLTDDSYSGAVPIGFSFDFYGNTNTQCVIGSNGVISFDLADANAYCSYVLDGTPLPNAAVNESTNSCMPAFHDINPNTATSPTGEILYQTFGTAPNRFFIVLYKDIYAFGGGGECSYLGIILYESTNIVEYHVGYKPIAATWNNGLAVQGMQNAAGNIAHWTVGRNNTQWNTIQDGKRYTPDAPNSTNNYTVTDIPYTLITSVSSTFQWEATNGNTYPYNSGSLLVSPVFPGTTGYFLSGQACGNSLGAITDTTWVTRLTVSGTTTVTDDICSSGSGSVTVNPVQGDAPFTYNWPSLNSTNQTVNNVQAGNHQVEITDANGCTSTAQALVGDTPANYDSTFTLVSCAGGSDGTATATMVPELGTISYQWNDPLGQTTQTAIGLTAGTYSCTITSDIGCSNTVSVTVTEIPGLTATISNLTDVTCNSGNDGMIEITATLGSTPYSYNWSGSSLTTNTADDLFVGPQSVTISDANGCSITIDTVLSEPNPLDITFITPDTQICPEDDIELSVIGSGGSSNYSYTWNSNGVNIGNTQNITVDPDVTGTVYCVTLSEACGSPTDQECVTINFPTPIIPSAIPDEYEKCIPNTFEFTNTSTNPSEVATTFWEFSDNPTHNILKNGVDSCSHYFDILGYHSVTMTVTSIYGCVYTDTMVNLIEVKDSPDAEFSFSSNPTTIFETSILMQNASSSDVVMWNWYSPGSSPSYSSSESPNFTFPEGVVGEYPVQLIVETARGCIDTVEYIMHVLPDILFYAPNAFTPDGDEFNQSWKPVIEGIDEQDYEILIFNRWGELIWESHDINVGWDGTYNGKRVPQGSYSWVAKVKSSYNDDKKTFSGSITILK